jgi:flagellar biogenesis protein FliO
MIYATLGNYVFSFEAKYAILCMILILTWLLLRLLVTVAIGKHGSQKLPMSENLDKPGRQCMYMKAGD